VNAVYLLGALVVVIVLVRVMAKERRVRRAIARTPRIPIARFPSGTPGRIVGKIAAGERITTPFTDRACVLYVATVEEERTTTRLGSPGRLQTWYTIAREVRGVPFAIEDDTGRALVDPADAQLALERDGAARSGVGLWDGANPAQEAFLARHGVSSKGWLGGDKRLRYREAALMIGETIAVCGVAVRELDPDRARRPTGDRPAPPTRVRLARTPEHALLISDDEQARA
jgi:hypothetical protein